MDQLEIKLSKEELWRLISSTILAEKYWRQEMENDKLEGNAFPEVDEEIIKEIRDIRNKLYEVNEGKIIHSI